VTEKKKPVIKDSGNRQAFSTGAVRDIQAGKGRYDLLPMFALKKLTQHFENGGAKYGYDNWQKGIPLTRMLDSAIRHAFKALSGLEDEDHLSAAAWNILCALDLKYRAKLGMVPSEIDNIPKYDPELYARVLEILE